MNKRFYRIFYRNEETGEIDVMYTWNYSFDDAVAFFKSCTCDNGKEKEFKEESIISIAVSDKAELYTTGR